MADYDVTTAGASLEFDTQDCLEPACCMIDENHSINFWRSVDNDAQAQVFAFNTTTWAVTTANSALEFDAGNGGASSCFKVDDNHFINFWKGTDDDGFVQIFEVNTSTWAVTTAGASLEFDTTANSENTCCQVDTNHFINFWVSNGGTSNLTQVFTVNTSTWAITTANSSLEFETQAANYNSCCKVDTNHFVNFWNGVGSDGFTQTFEVNTTTWAVTTASSVLEFDTQESFFNSCCNIDENHVINFWGGASVHGFTQVFEINTSTWAITTANSPLEYYTEGINLYNSCCEIDTNHFINFWYGLDGDGYTQTFTVNTSTWAVTTQSATLEFDTQSNAHNACCQIDVNHYVNSWVGVDGDGFSQVFNVELTALLTLDFLVNAKLTPSFITMAQKTFLENIALAPIFTKLLTSTKTFLENTKLTSFKLFTVSKSFLSNIVLTPIFSTLASKTFAENIKLTPIFSKVLLMLKTFAENIKLTSFINFSVSKTFTETMTMTSAFFTQAQKSFLENIKSTTNFVKVPALMLAENIKMTTTTVFAIARTFTANIVMTSILKITLFFSFLSNMILTPTFAKITTFFKVFTENIKLKTAFRMIMNGISVGRWSQTPKPTTIWTKTPKK